MTVLRLPCSGIDLDAEQDQYEELEGDESLAVFEAVEKLMKRSPFLTPRMKGTPMTTSATSPSPSKSRCHVAATCSEIKRQSTGTNRDQDIRGYAIVSAGMWTGSLFLVQAGGFESLNRWDGSQVVTSWFRVLLPRRCHGDSYANHGRATARRSCNDRQGRSFEVLADPGLKAHHARVADLVVQRLAIVLRLFQAFRVVVRTNAVHLNRALTVQRLCIHLQHEPLRIQAGSKTRERQTTANPQSRRGRNARPRPYLFVPLMPDDEVLDVEAAGRLLRIGRNSVYELVGRNAIPHRRLGKHIRFSRNALFAWLASWAISKEGK